MPEDLSSVSCDEVGVIVEQPAACKETGTSVSKETPFWDHYFSTSHLLDSLRERTISSAFVAILSQIAQAILNVASVMVLARLLVPDDFGLIAMVTAVTNVFVVVRDAGLSAATIQKEGITHAQVSNLFWVNVAVGGFLTVTVAAAAPLVARFYNEPRLTGIGLAMSLNFLLGATTVQHMALLARQMQFRAMAYIQVAAMAVGFLVGVGTAIAGLGYWSLVVSTLSIEASRVVLTWTSSSWRPRLPSRSVGTAGLLRFGASMTAGSSLYFVARSLDSLLIGRRYGSDSLGFYSRATTLFTRPLEQVLIPLGSVFMPALSRLQSQPARYRQAFLRGYEALTLVGCISAAIFLALSQPLTLVLLGPKWEKAASILTAFGIAALYFPPSIAAGWLLITQGRSKDYLVMNITTSTLIALAVVAGLPFGPFGVALSFSVSGLLIRLPILYWIIGRRGPVGILDLWGRFLRHLPLWLVVLSVTYFTYVLSRNWQAFAQLIICLPIGIVAGLATILTLPYERRLGGQMLRTIRSVIRTNISN